MALSQPPNLLSPHSSSHRVYPMKSTPVALNARPPSSPRLGHRLGIGRMQVSCVCYSKRFSALSYSDLFMVYRGFGLLRRLSRVARTYRVSAKVLCVRVAAPTKILTVRAERSAKALSVGVTKSFA